MFEYKEKKKGVFVETNMFAIDSPGEIREISQRGWESRKNTSSKTKTNTKDRGLGLKLPSIKGFEKKISRRLFK